MGHSREHRADHIQSDIIPQLSDDSGQRLAFHVFHDDVGHVTFYHAIVNGDDVRIVQMGGSARLLQSRNGIQLRQFNRTECRAGRRRWRRHIRTTDVTTSEGLLSALLMLRAGLPLSNRRDARRGLSERRRLANPTQGEVAMVDIILASIALALPTRSLFRIHGIQEGERFLGTRP